MQTLILGDEKGGYLEVPDSTLLVWLDETGHEYFADKSYPLFGLGGCVVEAKNYFNTVRIPWLNIKNEYFPAISSLHAADLRDLSKEQLTSISNFFINQNFKRVAAVSTNKTILKNELIPYEVTAICLMERIRKVSADMSFNKIYLILEKSSRGDKFAEKYLVNHPFKKTFSGKVIDVEFKYFLMPKNFNEPGLEVADFIMHSVGGHARARLNGNVQQKRKDFSVTFPTENQHLHSYFEINQAIVNT